MAKPPAPSAGNGHEPMGDGGAMGGIGDDTGEDEASLFDERLFFAEQAPKGSGLKKPGKLSASLPPSDISNHYHGHRERLRNRFRDGGETALADYEVLELLLFRLIPRRDTKPIAKALIDRFGTLGDYTTL